jgi:hypothetical protein
MGLIGFHRVLIVTAAVFFAGYGLWEFAAFVRRDDVTNLLLAAGSFSAAVLLLLYVRRLSRILGLEDPRSD